LAKKAESTFKERIYPSLKALPHTWAQKIQQRTIHGTPDFLLCIRGRFVALELKKDDKSDADPLQLYTLEKINQAGGFCFVVTPVNWPEVLDFLKRLSQGEIND